MNRGLSLYLDLLRLVAAFEVFVFHLAGFSPLGVSRAGWNAYGHEAVTIFFVLSGFVIRHAAGHRNATLDDFMVSRLTRVWSVALPCLLLTLVFDTIGQHFEPTLYEGLIPSGSQWLRLGIGAAMLNEVWVSVQMLSNTPYWSTSYEFWYYVIFAALFYFKGWARIALGCLFALLSGPKIMLLFPIWLLGWAAYSERISIRFPKWLSVVLFVQPVAFLMFYDQFNLSRWGQDVLVSAMGYDQWHDGLAWSRYVLSDTLLGISVTLHLLGAKGLGDRLWSVLQSCAKPIRYFAGQSFTLYLLHQPALLCIGAALAAWPLGGARGLVVAVLTFLTVMVVATATEGQKHRFKPAVAWLVGLVRAVFDRWSRRKDAPACSQQLSGLH